MHDIMVDLETLDTTASAVIMSIGAVRFDLNSEALDNDGFYASICIESNLLAQRTISESTLCWWMGQSAAAQNVFKEPKNTLSESLILFDEWVGEDRDKVNVWSNGADFDLPMLTHAYRSFGWDTPWLFYNSRCVRTYKNLPIAKNVPRPDIGVKHNALSDAIAQAMHVQAIHKALCAKA